ncbi:MAG: ZIP family metal transporter [Bdellovibrionota bacterium]
MTLLYIILAGLLLCFASIIASGILLIKEAYLKKIIFPVVSISSGVFLGAAFLFLIPESLELLGDAHLSLFFVLLGFLTFLFLEEVLEWHHCHKMPSEHKLHNMHHNEHHNKNHKDKLGWLITFSDFFHNAIDGASIAATFIISPNLGLVTTISTFLHELPQEIGDIGILIHSGAKKKKAFLLNLLSQLTFFVGAFFVYFSKSKGITYFLIPFTAGTFIYISAVDLLPEIKSSSKTSERLLHILYFLLGIFFIYILMMHFHHNH